MEEQSLSGIWMPHRPHLTLPQEGPAAQLPSGESEGELEASPILPVPPRAHRSPCRPETLACMPPLQSPLSYPPWDPTLAQQRCALLDSLLPNGQGQDPGSRL